MHEAHPRTVVGVAIAGRLVPGRTRWGAGALLLLGLGGCGGEAESATAASVSMDSAGVQIVTSAGPAWGAGEEWRIGATPLVEIGMAEGPNEYLLAGVRAARRRGDGSILVANGQTNEVRIFAADGRHVRTVGREGAGPGEFTNLTWLGAGPADSILAFDYMAHRLSFFSPTGEFVRAVTVDGSGGGSYPLLLGLFGDGSMAAATIDFAGASAADGEVTRPAEQILRFSATGELLDTLARIPGSESYMERETSGQMQIVMMSTLLFGRTSTSALAGDRLVLGSNDSYELQMVTPEGQVERLIRRAVEPRPVTEEMLAAARRERAAQAPTEEERARRERSLQDAPHGNTVPYYQRVVGDDAGNLWVHEFAVPGEDPPAWAVFDPSGRLLGTVQLPEGLRPMHIGDGFVLGVERDELDVEQVRMYALEKPALE